VRPKVVFMLAALALPPNRCKGTSPGAVVHRTFARAPHEPLSCVARCRIWQVNSKEVRFSGHNDCP
jgi:hypothetical protein